MSIKITTVSSNRTILTPSTIQCTKFYRNNFNGLLNLLKEKLPITSSTSNSNSTGIKPLGLVHRSNNTFTCLELQLAKKIQYLLPKRISISSKWSLLYSLDQHGASLSTLYNKCFQAKGPCLLIIQNEQDEIFGAYLSENLHIQSGYYGTGECFLFKLNNNKQIIPYYWSMLNDYMIYSNHDFLAIGGGQGKFGLWLNSDLIHGYTQPCNTFNNSSLCQHSAFKCIALEIWSFEF